MRVLACVLLLTALAGCGDRGDATATTPPAAAVESPQGSTTATERRSLRLAVLGDSYSNGEAVGIDRSWPAVMAAELTQDGLPTEVVANPSVTGATTAQMLATGLPPIRASRPDVMTVMLGVNDQVQGRTPAQFEADVDRAIGAAVEITGSAGRVIAVDIPDYSVAPVARQFGDLAAIARQVDAFNRVVRRVAARRHVRFASIVGISRRLGSGGIAGDGLHPSAAQLADWAAAVAPVAIRTWRVLPR